MSVMWSIRVPITAVAAFATFAAAEDRSPVTAQDVVSHVRTALGIGALAKHASGIRLTGDCRMVGVDCDFELVMNADGRFMQRMSATNESIRGFGVTYGFDGSRAWTNDLGGETRIIELGDRETAILNTGIISGRWFGDGAPITFALHTAGAGEPAGESTVTLDFQLTDGQTSGTVVIDSTTWLPRTWTFGDGQSTQTINASGTVSAPGGAPRFPAKLEQSSTSGLSIVINVTNAAEAPAYLRSPYEPVLGTPSDVKFDASISPALEVKKSPMTGHLLVHPTVNGKDVGWFIFDTGAGSNCLDSRAANELGVEKFGSIPAMGAGGAVAASLCRADLTLGPVMLEKSMLTILDFAFLDQYMGVKVAGIVGYGLLERCVAEFDGRAGAISLHNPATFDSKNLKWQKLTLYNRHPCVEASFEDHTGLFKLDTGAQGTVTMHYDAVQKLNLLEGRETTAASQGGVGGRVSAKSGTLRWFELGGVRNENVQAIFAGENKGAFADKYTIGNIGGTLLQPFTLVFDYPHDRIAFVKREPAPDK